MPKKPLEGIRIADFSWVYAGPLLTKTLADYGAQVIKIEGKTKPDGERVRSPYKDGIPGVNRATDFNYNNTSKLSFTLNLANPKGKEIAKRLVAKSDIVVENFAGGIMTKMGFGYEVLRKVKPDIIMLSASMQGQTGPYSSQPGYGHQLTALSGFHQVVGWPDRRPQHYSAHTDFLTPHFGITCILAALDYRNRTGKGRYFDISQYEIGVQFMAHLVLDYQINNRVAVRAGNTCAYAAPHGAYCCRGNDRWCTIAVFSDTDWGNLRKIIGNPEWSHDTRFATLTGRKEHEDELNKLVEAWTINHSDEAVMNLIQSAGICSGAVSSHAQLLKDPQLSQANFLRVVEHKEVGKYRTPRPPYQLSKGEAEVRVTPLLGEHTEYICKHIIGMTDEEISESVIAGAIE